MIGIYIINGPERLSYVGQSIDINQRWSLHRSTLRLGKHKCKELQRDWDLYGEHLFSFEVLEECSLELLTEKEQYWMDQAGQQALYNTAPAAGTNRGMKVRPEIVQRMKDNHYRNTEVKLKDGRRYKNMNEFAVACGYATASGVSMLARKGLSFDEIADKRGLFDGVIKEQATKITLSNGLCFPSINNFAKTLGVQQATITKQLKIRTPDEIYNQYCDGYTQKKIVTLSTGQEFSSGYEFAKACGYSSWNAVLYHVRKGLTYDAIFAIRTGQ